MQISVQNLSLELNKNKILDNINLTIQKGKISTIIGKNGSGKSTLLKTMARLIKQTQGDIILDGKKINDFSQNSLAKKISFLAQNQDAIQTLTVHEMVSMGRFPHQSLHCKQSAQDKQIIHWAMEVTDIQKFSSYPLKNLSGGQRQRVFIAMNLAQESEYLFLDEPTTYLDISSQIELMTLIQKINKEKNKTIIMVLHDLNQAFEVSDWILIMKDGKIYSQGGANTVMNKQMFTDVFGVRVGVYKNDDGKTIFHPEEVTNLSESTCDDEMNIEKKFLISCVRENIFSSYTTDNETNMVIKLDENNQLQFKIHMFKTCQRFIIKGNIYHHIKNIKHEIVTKINFFSLMKPFLNQEISL